MLARRLHQRAIHESRCLGVFMFDQARRFDAGNFGFAPGDRSLQLGNPPTATLVIARHRSQRLIRVCRLRLRKH